MSVVHMDGPGADRRPTPGSGGEGWCPMACCTAEVDIHSDSPAIWPPPVVSRSTLPRHDPPQIGWSAAVVIHDLVHLIK